jgi:hypothetical protein
MNEPFCASSHFWNPFMNRHSFSSPIIITVEAADGKKRQYPIKDLTKALAAMRWYGIRQFTELRACSPGIWLIAAAALACAHEHPDPATIEHARQMFVSLAKAAGILAGM